MDTENRNTDFKRTVTQRKGAEETVIEVASETRGIAIPNAWDFAETGEVARCGVYGESVAQEKRCMKSEIQRERGAEVFDCDAYREVDERMMTLALREAQKASEEGEVPVGAVLIDGDGKILAASGNRKERERNPLKHAETVVMDEGIRTFGKYLTGCTLYVTLEPCAMCAGAMVNARLGRLVFGAFDKKGGAAGTSMDVFGNPSLNHAVAVTGGILEKECARILGEFFKRRREEKKCL